MSEEQLIQTPGVFGENGNFLLERELGRGGMGGVYMGRDKMLDRPVAVKVMLKEYGSDAEFVEKFKKEAQAAAKLIHPNIAQVYSYGISGGMPYIAMELVAGGSLDKLMATHGAGIDVPRVMKICEQVAQALRCAADQGLVHGDVKPENILLDANGNAKLVDFGLAAMQKDTNEIWGTPYYIAPEKVKKQPVDYRADMYSLGGTIYHALTGVAPYEGDDALEVVKKRFQGMPKKPSAVRPGLSPQIDFLVMKMLETEPHNRYPSFEALLEDFKKVMTTGLSATQSLASAEAEGTATGKSKRLVLKTKRNKPAPARPSAQEGSAAADGDGEVADLPAGEAPQGKVPGRFKKRLANEEEYADEEGGSHIGIVLGAVALVIALIVGGLFWYWTSFQAGEAAAAQAQIERGLKSVSENYAVLNKEIDTFETQMEKIMTESEAKCKSIHDDVAKKMKEVYPQSYIDLLSIPKTAALVKAERELAAASAPPADTNATALAAAPAEGAAPAAAAPAAAAAAPRFRPPVGDEVDPMSPEHEKYMQEKAKWEEEQKAKADAPAAEPAAGGEASEGAAAEEEALDKPTCIEKVNKIWEAMYDCQAAAITVRRGLAEIKDRVAKNSALPPPESRTDETVRRYNDTQIAINNAFKDLKSSDSVSQIQKISGLLDSRGKKARKECHDQVKRIKEKRAEKEREKRLAEELENEKRRLAEEQAALRAKEVAEAKELYDGLVSDGNIRTLNWNACSNKILIAKSKMKSGEGKVEADFQVLKVQMMADVQRILQRNLKGWTFRSGEGKNSKAKPIKNWTVTDVDDRRITLASKSGEKREITWMKLYNDYHANFGDIIKKFIRNGDKNGNPTLNKLERVNAMIGASLTLYTICTDDATSEGFADKMAKEALKTFPEMSEKIRKLFPDKDFSAVEAEAASENL